jgi:hypothetical protein
MADKLVAIVIPFYRNTISPLEEVAIKQCFQVLSNYPIVCIKPFDLDLSNVLTRYAFADVINFDVDFFTSIQGYNRLMLSTTFYNRFLNYEYILLYQLDAYVFRDELQYWCKQNYDYIGAPWLRDHDYPDIIKKLKSKFLSLYDTKFNIQKNGLPSDMQFENKVGNGGFSLRRVKKLCDLTVNYGDLIDYYNSKSDNRFHEDVFWSIEVNRKKNQLKIPGYRKALKFAFENSPERCLKLNNNNLPFGCHAWDKYLGFWKPFIESEEYILNEFT